MISSGYGLPNVMFSALNEYLVTINGFPIGIRLVLKFLVAYLLHFRVKIGNR